MKAKRKYQQPRIRSEVAFEQETMACLKTDGGCQGALPRTMGERVCRNQMIRMPACYERTQS